MNPTTETSRRRRKPRCTRSEKRQRKELREQLKSFNNNTTVTSGLSPPTPPPPPLRGSPHPPLRHDDRSTTNRLRPQRPHVNNSRTTTDGTTFHVLQSRHRRLLKCADDAYDTGSVSIQWEMCDHYDGPPRKLEQDPGLTIITDATEHDLRFSFDKSIDKDPNIDFRLVIKVKPLIILDVNGVLCHRVRSRDVLYQNGVKENCFRPSCGNVASTDIIPRTDLTLFLEFLDRHFTLAIWSSAKHKTLKGLLSMLVPPEIASRLLFVWDQRKCARVDTASERTDLTIGSQDVDNKLGPSSLETTREKTSCEGRHGDEMNSYKNILFKKSLAKVFKEYPLWNDNNTLIMDDTPDKFDGDCRRNALHPPPINGFVFPEDFLYSNNTSDTDYQNQEKQFQFFKLLAEQWRIKESQHSASVGRGSFQLQSFLRQHAVDHMGWRDPDPP